jgi:pullulanase
MKTARILVCYALAIVALYTAHGASRATALAPSLPSSIRDCDLPAFQTILSAAPKDAVQNDVQAVWLNGRTLRWPGAKLMGNGDAFRLHLSATGQIVAKVGVRAMGVEKSIALAPFAGELPAELASRFKYVGAGATLMLHDKAIDVAALHRQQMVIVHEDSDGQVLRASGLQIAGALDDRFWSGAIVRDFGATLVRAKNIDKPRETQFKLWAPTAQRVQVCLYKTGGSSATSAMAMQYDDEIGVWELLLPHDLNGQFYTYLVDVFVPNVGVVRNRVTDPYSLSLTTDSKRSYIVDLNEARLKPNGWDKAIAPSRIKSQTDMTIYELHVRDFSINDPTVSEKHRGKYLAFTESQSNGMQHLSALSKAGMTDVHLLPVFDLATVPEKGCVTPKPTGEADSEAQQAAAMADKASDCFNWGYDPYHYTAPEGSYATDAADGAKRIIEFRQMVQALHRAGLRVGMDVVYNHTAVAGQNEKSVLDRIVPGYYHRLNAKGEVERSTCCDNTATENRMMEKLMIDSTVTWARDYKIDSFRFDLMGHQPRSAMEKLRAALIVTTGRDIQLIGEGWNFGEVENGARFVQASQLSLNGSMIGTFSDRARDAVRGGGPSDSGADLVTRQGYINGLVYDKNSRAPSTATSIDLMRTADMVRVGLAGSLSDYSMKNAKDEVVTLAKIDYNGQPAGYVSEPGEVVNYVENHDNQTLFDINAYKLPITTSREDRARVQLLGLAINAFSQGIAYFHAGGEILRSKSMDRNSYDSGDWFNRIDWSMRDNYFATGLPPKDDNANTYAEIKPLFTNALIKPTEKEIRFTRDAFLDLLRIRASSTLFRLRTAKDIKARLSFANVGSAQISTVIAAHLDGTNYAGAKFAEVVYVINVDKIAQTVVVDRVKGKAFALHPVHLSADAADKRIVRETKVDAASGTITVPPRSAVVLVHGTQPR